MVNPELHCRQVSAIGLDYLNIWEPDPVKWAETWDVWGVIEDYM